MWPFKKKDDDHHGSAAAAHAHMQKIGKWHIDEKVLGEGGYGKVVRAYDYSMQPPLISACKMIDTRRMKRAAIEREVRVNQKLSHRNIAAVLDYLFIEPIAYVFLELCAGGELFEKVISAGRMEEATARAYFIELCQGVQHCHSRGVVHRDLKLENVMLSDKGTLKIIDFGLAAEYEPLGDGSFALVTLYETCGSKSYAAPEVLSGKGYSGFGADVWSCGICLFAMLAGFFPLDEATNRDWRYQRVSKAVAQGASLTATIYAFYQRPCPLSIEAVALLDGMLNLDPSRRLSLDAVLQSPWVLGRRMQMQPAGAAGSAGGDGGGARAGGGGMAAGRGHAGTVPAPSELHSEEGPHYRSIGNHEQLAQMRMAAEAAAQQQYQQQQKHAGSSAHPGSHLGANVELDDGEAAAAAMGAHAADGSSAFGEQGGHVLGGSGRIGGGAGSGAGGGGGGFYEHGYDEQQQHFLPPQHLIVDDEELVYRSFPCQPPPQLARQFAFERYDPTNSGAGGYGMTPPGHGGAEAGLALGADGLAGYEL